MEYIGSIFIVVLVVALVLTPFISYITVAIAYPLILLHLAFFIVAIVFGVKNIRKVASTKQKAHDMAEDAVKRSFAKRRKEIEQEINNYTDQIIDQICDLEENISWTEKEIDDIIKYREIDDLTDEDIDAFFFGLAYCPSFELKYNQSWLHQYCEYTEDTFQKILEDFLKSAVEYDGYKKMNQSDPKRSQLEFVTGLLLVAKQNMARAESVQEKNRITKMIESGSKTWKIHFIKILRAVMVTEIIIDITSRMETKKFKESNREVCDDMRKFKKQLIDEESKKPLSEEQKIFVRLVEKGVKKVKYMDKIDLKAIYYS